jgi:hypothetical protein
MIRSAAFLCLVLLGGLPAMADDKAWATGAWGVDALLSTQVAEAEVPAYLALLQRSGVRIVRERDTGTWDIDPTQRDYRVTYRCLGEAGLRVVAFAQENRDLGRTVWGPFPEDLRVVYAEGKRLGRAFAGLVEAWELHNEADLGWWPDMPDRFGAHAKALYLGLKAGASEAGVQTPVMLGALGLPPGPWLERLARNGLLDYADAWNAHYYGEISQFGGFLSSNVNAMRELNATYRSSAGAATASRWRAKGGGGRWSSMRPAEPLPMWLSEVGIKTVTAATWDDPGRREKQADFILATAKCALAQPEVAVFMPFVLVHKDDPYAITESATRTWPAWDDYAEFSRKVPWPRRPLYSINTNNNPVVLQWLASRETAEGHKVAGSYRWRTSGVPVRGELRLYNFGSRDVAGSLHGVREPETGWGRRGATRWSPSGLSKSDAAQARNVLQVNVPAGGMVGIPLEFPVDQAPGVGTREWRQFCFRSGDGRRSWLGFALEQTPEDRTMESFPLQPVPWDTEPRWSLIPNRAPSGSRGLWRAINGVRVLTDRADGLARFELTGDPTDPEYPPMAALRLVGGLEGYSHLRVSSRRLLPQAISVRVDLVDEAGRRFTVWENLGKTGGQGPEEPTWMALADFHPFAWGVLDGRRRLRPNEIREVQLRFYAQKAPAMVDLEIRLAKGKRL